MITIEGYCYCLKIITLDKKWVVFVQRVMNQKLGSIIAHHQVMILSI